jgi:M6 family metalloprotease-like protein
MMNITITHPFQKLINSILLIAIVKTFSNKILIISLFLFLCHSSFAAYLTNHPVEVAQPDATIVQCYVTGDEYHHRVHDEDGYTIIRDPKTGYLVYAVLKNDELVSSGYFVGKTDPKTLDILPNIDISAKKRTQIRSDFWDKIPQKQALPTFRATTEKNKGTLNNLVIYIRFSDDSEFNQSKSEFEELFNKEEEGSSLYSYYRDISNGTLLIPSTFYPETAGTTVVSYIDINPRSTYANAPENQQAVYEHPLLKRAIEAVSSQVPSSLNLDYDNDGYVDNVCFIVKGNAGAWSSLLWPHRWVLYNENVSINGKRVWDYNFIIENHLFTTGNGKQSVLVHETYHTLGAPDLYRYDDNTITPVGPWDVMASNTIPPQSSIAHITHKYGGWIGDIPEISISSTYTLYDAWDRTPSHNIAYKIISPNSSSEYFVLEYRNKSSNVYEAQLPGSGIIIYRVKPSINDGNAGGPPDEVYVFRPGANNNTTNGTLNSACFSSQTGRTIFSDTSNPPCFLSNNSPGLAGIVISEIGASGGETMTFKVTFPVAGSPVATAATDEGKAGFTAHWTPSSGATDYLLSVYYKANGNEVYTDGGFSDQSVGNVISYPVTGLDRAVATEWYFTVKAVSGGVPSDASNEITVQLAEFDPVSCKYATNMLPEESLAWYTSGGGPIGGHANSITQYAEYYQLPDIGKVSGFKMNVQDLKNNSNDPAYAKITVKLWTASNGTPGDILYSQDFPFSELATGENTLSFSTPTIVPTNFFIGYEIYYASKPDVFGVNITAPRGIGGKNTAYLLRSGSWRAFNQYYTVSSVGLTTSFFLFPDVCTLPEGTKWKPENNSTDWNDVNNWDNGVPEFITQVTIQESASYPILTSPVTVNKIHFEAGAEIGRQDLLTYTTAEVDYAIPTPDRWYMLAVPVQGIKNAKFLPQQ